MTKDKEKKEKKTNDRLSRLASQLRTNLHKRKERMRNLEEEPYSSIGCKKKTNNHE